MCVGYSWHRVDLEVFVGANRGRVLDWSPIGERRFSIVKPLIAQVAHMIRVNVRNSLCDFRPRNPSIQVEHLGANLLHDVRSWLNGHELVPEGVSSAHNFHVIHEVRVDGWLTNAAVVHLTSENFISEEPVTENAAIAIWRIKALLSCDIN